MADPKIYVAIHRDSQLAGLLGRLAVNSTIQTSEVTKTWKQKARGGGFTELSGSKAAFILDAIGEAIDGPAYSKEERGQVTVSSINSALFDSLPAGVSAMSPQDKALLESTIARMEKEGKDQAAIIEQLQGELKDARAKVTVQADKITVKAQATEDKKQNDDLIVPTTFPEVPVNRASMGEKFIKPEWFDLMAAALDSGRHVSLAGPPGPGKSTAPEEYFIRKGQPFVIINAEGGMRRRDLEGKEGVANGRSFFQTANFAAAAIFGWGCILNEVNAAEADALLVINGVVETPKTITVNGKNYPVHPNFRLVVTYNPGLTGTKPLPQSFKDRFFPVKLGFVSQEFLRKMLMVHGMPANASYARQIINFAIEVWQVQEKGGLRYQISPRRLFDAIFLMETPSLKMTLRSALEAAVLAVVDTKSDADVLKGIIEGY